LKAPVGTLLTTALLILTSGDKDKAVASSLNPALPLLSLKNGVLAQKDPVLVLAVLVGCVRLIASLTAASGSMLLKTMTVILLQLSLTPDFLVYKPSVEVLVLSASKVLSIARGLDLNLLSASNIAAVALDLAPSLTLKSELRPSNVPQRVAKLLLAMRELLTALILCHGAALLELRPVLVVAWVEELALAVHVLAITVLQVKTVR